MNTDSSQTDVESVAGQEATIPEQNRVDDSPEYGRPNYEVSYYSERINAHAFSTFSTRHDAIGYIAKALRNEWMKRPTLKYNSSFDRKDSATLQSWANSW
jgi:hypothetical protein